MRYSSASCKRRVLMLQVSDDLYELLTYAHVCSRMRTYADVYSRMLTYADVCSRLLTYAGKRRPVSHRKHRRCARVSPLSVTRIRGRKKLPTALLILYSTFAGRLLITPDLEPLLAGLWLGSRSEGWGQGIMQGGRCFPRAPPFLCETSQQFFLLFFHKKKKAPWVKQSQQPVQNAYETLLRLGLSWCPNRGVRILLVLFLSTASCFHDSRLE